MEIEITEPEVVKPPVTVTLTLTEEEAQILRLLAGRIHGNSSFISRLYNELPKGLPENYFVGREKTTNRLGVWVMPLNNSFYTFDDYIRCDN